MIREGLSFDDVLLVPQHSQLESRDRVEVGVNLAGASFNHPIVPANMASVATFKLLQEQVKSGGLAVMHRFQPIAEQINTFNLLGTEELVAASIGVKKEDERSFRMLLNAGVWIFVVDVAHGDSSLAVEMVAWIKAIGGRRTHVIAGNVATRQGAKRLYDVGADAVKVGVGPGSLCTTRIETGCGVPQLTALMDVAELRNEHYPTRGIIADGGIKNAGDCVKALCFADMVMAGRMFAGCDEIGEPDYRVVGEGAYRFYRGSSTHKTRHVEGVVARVPASGSYSKVLSKLMDGIRSGCSYQGAQTVKNLQDHPEFIKITAAGLRESYPHDVQIVEE